MFYRSFFYWAKPLKLDPTSGLVTFGLFMPNSSSVYQKKTGLHSITVKCREFTVIWFVWLCVVVTLC